MQIWRWTSLFALGCCPKLRSIAMQGAGASSPESASPGSPGAASLLAAEPHDKIAAFADMWRASIPGIDPAVRRLRPRSLKVSARKVMKVRDAHAHVIPAGTCDDFAQQFHDWCNSQHPWPQANGTAPAAPPAAATPQPASGDAADITT